MAQDLPVGVVETHSAVVTFIGDRAYKVKKPVDLGFLDFTTREAREAACHREVELNRRMAPDVYLGVADVTRPRRAALRPHGGDAPHAGRAAPGDPVGRGPRRGRLCARGGATGRGAARGRPELARGRGARDGGDAGRGGGQLAGQPRRHGALRRRAARRRGVRPGAVARPAVPGGAPGPVRRADPRGPRPRRPRGPAGRGRVLPRGRAADPRLPRVRRPLPVRGRAARRGVPGHGPRTSRPPRPRPPVPAVVRRVQRGARPDQPDRALRRLPGPRPREGRLPPARPGRGGAGEEAARLHRLVLEHLSRARTVLLLVGGLPGTGKSTVAGGLAEDHRWALLRSDEVRKDLAAVGHRQPHAAEVDEGLYRPERVAQVYDELLDRARRLLAKGESVVWTPHGPRPTPGVRPSTWPGPRTATSCSSTAGWPRTSPGPASPPASPAATPPTPRRRCSRRWPTVPTRGRTRT